MSVVLFVDDKVKEISSFKAWLRPDFQMHVAKDTRSAIQFLKKNLWDVTVAVVDMVLEAGDDPLGTRSGIDLIRKIKALDYTIEAIVLTGYPSNVNMKEALEAGAKCYVMKGQTDTREILLAAIQQAHFGALRNREYRGLLGNFVEEQKVGKWLGRESVTFSMEQVERVRLDASQIDEKAWNTVQEVQLGQRKEIEEVIELDKVIKLEQTFGLNDKVSLEGSIGQKLVANLKGKLSSELSRYLSETQSTAAKRKLSVRTVIELAEPSDYSKRYATKREYQVALLYEHVKLTLGMVCSACGMQKKFNLLLQVPTDTVVTRVRTTFHNGEVEIS